MTEQISRRYVPAQFARGKPRLFIVGEAPGEEEAIEGKPFVGRAGQLLNQILKALDVEREDCHITNVFKIRPPENNVGFFFETITEAKKSGLNKTSKYPMYSGIGYLKPDFSGFLDELKGELLRMQPDIVVALGNTAMWALTGLTGVAKLRGHLTDCALGYSCKVLMTYHPAAVLRQWEYKPLIFNDIQKALTYNSKKEINRLVLLEPNLHDLEMFYEDHIKQIKGTGIPLTFDIETGTDRIRCIGFAVGGVSIVVPFDSGNINNPSYWKTADEEVQALTWVKGILEDPTITKLGHNVLYDIQWLREKFGICTAQPIHDTMVMFHSVQPEMKKSLNELVSMYTYAPPWKTWVSHKEKTSENKKDN